ncbi:MAG: hypothetical protein JRF56_20355 [Deltaproteobacteria bacterium]|jgi:uncharacterized membrane protein YraQ (UPF0718 family)|nr:hypothetical protein [Deltaproteobacteria bacterium]
MDSKSKGGRQFPTKKKHARRMLFFPTFILAIYGALFTVNPDKAIEALGSSGKIFLHIAAPVTLVFGIIVVINLFLKPNHVARFLGRESGIKGMVFSAIGGIISMGPIYAWYPLLKDLREKGAANILIAIFLGNRAVKPFLMPIMISYFGWVYVLILTFFTITGSVVAGYIVRILVKE